jgi:tRNA(fMet)-specific endonuclease VapC
MNTVVLDTDTLSAIMRQESTAVSVAQLYLKTHHTLTISIITRFEVLRGLMAKNAASQISAFNATCVAMEVLPLNDAIIVRAAEIYGQLHRAGNLIGDADILIAATCLENGHALATNNTAHVSRISGLVVENWLAK